MRRALVLAVAVCALGCGGRAATKTVKPPPNAGAAKTRADGGRELAALTGTLAPEAAGPQHGDVDARRGKILGKDPQGCTWVLGDATVVVGDQDTTAQARAGAVEQARAAAVQDFLGVDVNSKFMDFQQEGLRRDAHLVESILQTTRNGRIIDEKIVDQGFNDAPGCPSCRYHVSLKACVLPEESDRDKDFRVELRLSRVSFVQGDEARLSITATRDCSVYLYDVYDLESDNKTALVVPNEAVPVKAMKAGETWEYPDDDAKKRGVHLVAKLPKDTDEISAETILVVATKTPLPVEVYDPTDGGYLGVFRRLHHSRTQWVEDAEAYTIRNR
jgi:hypothetical protein